MKTYCWHPFFADITSFCFQELFESTAQWRCLKSSMGSPSIELSQAGTGVLAMHRLLPPRYNTHWTRAAIRGMTKRNVVPPFASLSYFVYRVRKGIMGWSVIPSKNSWSAFLLFQTGDWASSACLGAIYHLLHHQCSSHLIITSFREIWYFDTTLFLSALHVSFIHWMLAN